MDLSSTQGALRTVGPPISIFNFTFYLFAGGAYAPRPLPTGLPYVCSMRSRLSPRCQSARERSVNDETERRKAGELERQRRREEAETSFQSWLREKQREAAEQRRQQRLKNAAQPANEVSVITHTHTHTRLTFDVGEGVFRTPKNPLATCMYQENLSVTVNEF